MNVKLHTPKSLKAGSGMASLKQFLLSIFATTVSIALTFGTAAIIDYNKKQSEKREIVMMVMYDMYNSLKSVEKADSMIRHTMEVQRQIAEDTSQFNKLKFQLVFLVPRVDYTEATERIFSSSIETINTVGNVLFTENVAKFYQMRQFYKTAICDSIANELERNNPFTTIRGTVNYAYSINALLSYNILKDLRHLYALCKQIMEVTDEEIDVYQKEREQIEKGLHEEDVVSDSIMNEIMELQRNIDELNVKIK
jgi:hypothetical protein